MPLDCHESNHVDQHRVMHSLLSARSPSRTSKDERTNSYPKRLRECVWPKILAIFWREYRRTIIGRANQRQPFALFKPAIRIAFHAQHLRWTYVVGWRGKGEYEAAGENIGSELFVLGLRV